MAALLATSYAFSKTFGLIIVFGGIGLLVTIIVMYIGVQVSGERQQNKAHLSDQDRTHPV
jgi:hypothetical protein